MISNEMVFPPEVRATAPFQLIPYFEGDYMSP